MQGRRGKIPSSPRCGRLATLAWLAVTALGCEDLDNFDVDIRVL